MDLPPSGSHDSSRELLRVDTNLFTLYIQGRPIHPTVETLQLHRNYDEQWVNGMLKVSSLISNLHIEEIKVFSPLTGDLVDWHEGMPAFPCFYETQNYELVVQKKHPPLELSFYHDNIHLRQSLKALGDTILSGMLNFGNEVGFTELELRLAGQTIFQLEIEVFPSKIDYKQDYQNLLNEVNRQIYNLSFDFMRRTYQLTGLRDTQNQSLTEYFTILQFVFDRLLEAVRRISMHPHHRLVTNHQVKAADKVRKAGKENIAFLTKRAHMLTEDSEHGYIRIEDRFYKATHLLECKKQISYDTNENRFVKWMLERVKGNLFKLKSRWREQKRKEDLMLTSRVDKMVNQVERLLQSTFLREVGGLQHFTVSLVLQMASGYQDVYRYYLMLLKGLSIQNDLLRLSMKDVAQLYEYWCFLKLNEILGRKYMLLSQDIITVNRKGIFVTLDKTQKARMEYRNPRTGEVFILHYNALPSKDVSPTLPQCPDNVLTLKKKDAGREKVYKYIFDAKYRLNPAYEDDNYFRSYRAPGPIEEDINTMHRYRDAIVSMDDSSKEFERSMFGAYVLFPYHDEERFKEHQFYKSIELMNVGAFPFLPNSTQLVEQFLDEIILDSPERAYERSTRPRGTKEYYANKLSGKNVLVGSLRDVSQLQVMLHHNIYHMPLKNLSDTKILTQLEYIAMCQSRKTFESTGQTGIHYYGKIKDWQVIRRGEIKERPARPGTENELYVKFTLEQWEKLERPIVLGGQRIYTLLYTTKYMLDRALEIAELKLETEEELKEWREKRRLGRVKVKLDHEFVDLAKDTLGFEVEEDK
ncbi:restriction endonuclease-like protein [Paenibacillus caui]|uniref:restriction endonuclease-like protein n=1 Tax=Paenibacillus caui TaxID=2873927 RepID=UPI001CA8CEED|nr:restriction endonuclease-like protein [Paenibacillus caui]